MNYDDINMQNLEDLKSGLISEDDKIQRLKFFAKGDKTGIDHLQEVENMSTEDTIGANYYLAQYLNEFLKGIQPSESAQDFSEKEKELEEKYMGKVLPEFAKKLNITNEQNFNYKRTWYPEEIELIDQLNKSIIDNSLQQIIRDRASIAFEKLANNQMLSSKDYGFILTRMALYLGDPTKLTEYNMLFLGLYHELSQGKDYGSFAENYLKDMVVSQSLVDSRFYPENETISMRR